MHIYKYVQPHIVILHQYVPVIPVTVTMTAHNKNRISVHIIVQKCMIKPLDITLDFSVDKTT